MYWDYAEEVKMPPTAFWPLTGERLGVLQVKIGLDDGAVVEESSGDGDQSAVTRRSHY